MIVIVAPGGDPHALAVGRALRLRGADICELDLARLPREGTVSLGLDPGDGARAVSFGIEGSLDVAVGDVEAVWWWRPRPLEPDPSLPPAERANSVRATAAALASAWATLPVRWVNDPFREEQALRKPFQLATAARLGLAIPRTLVTSDPGRARTFLAPLLAPGAPGAVMKALVPWPGVPIPTRRAHPADLPALDALRAAPVILQEYVDGVDLRVTIAGREVFALEVDARGSAHPEDCRLDAANAGRARAAALPDAIRADLLRVMDRLGLAYGAFDLRRRDSGEHVFLEVNPSGTWLFAEEATGHPITGAVARLLLGTARP